MKLSSLHYSDFFSKRPTWENRKSILGKENKAHCEARLSVQVLATNLYSDLLQTWDSHLFQLYVKNYKGEALIMEGRKARTGLHSTRIQTQKLLSERIWKLKPWPIIHPKNIISPTHTASLRAWFSRLSTSTPSNCGISFILILLRAKLWLN